MGQRGKSVFRKILLVLLAAASLGLVAASFRAGFSLELPYFNIWGIRFLALSLLTLSLGLVVGSPVLKSLFFSAFALFAALGLGEAYLNYKNADPGQTAARTEASSFDVPEFYFEVYNDFDPRSAELVTGGGHGDIPQAAVEVVADVDMARNYFVSHGYEILDQATTPPHAYENDPRLGYRNKKGLKQALALKQRHGQTIYAAIYNYNDRGYRMTPERPEAKEAVVFLGCSFTFGEGLHDRESYPYRVSELLGDNYQTFNLGESGYGTHQVLAIIEDGRLDEIAEKYDKIHVFYMTIPHHMERSAGKAFWDKNGPSYQLTEDGGVKYMGSFQEFKQTERKKSSLIFKQINEKTYMKDLHLALIRQADRVLKEKYGTGLVVLSVFYPEEYLKELEKDRIPLLTMFHEMGDDLKIVGDGHPNAKATALMAEIIAEYIKASK